MDGRIRVLVRVRPLVPRELLEDEVVWVNEEDSSITVTKDNYTLESNFDHIFSQRSTQEDVYSEVGDSIQDVIEGYNSTIFAYGQTGTGKTYTMLGGDFTGKHYKTISAAQGSDYDSDGEGAGERTDPVGKAVRHRGIIPRAVEELFRHANRSTAGGERETRIKCSYMEIYNERLHDLLKPYKPKKMQEKLDMVQRKTGLELREDKLGAIHIPELTETTVASAAAVLDLLHKGNKHRSVRHTEMNEHSSRSHTILQITVEQRSLAMGGAAQGEIRTSKLNLVDLAGSERWATSGDMEEERIAELTNINQSLSSLATVISFLSSKKPRSHIPYRDSKLTHLLQDSLGGNCKTSIIATLSPNLGAYDESCSTLKFADRARNIQTHAVVNAAADSSLQLEQARREIERLRNLLALYATDKPASGKGKKAAAASNLAVLEGRLAATEDDNKQLKQQLAAAKEALQGEREKRRMLAEAWAAGPGAGQLPEEALEGLDSPGRVRPPRGPPLRRPPPSPQPPPDPLEPRSDHSHTDWENIEPGKMRDRVAASPYAPKAPPRGGKVEGVALPSLQVPGRRDAWAASPRDLPPLHDTSNAPSDHHGTAPVAAGGGPAAGWGRSSVLPAGSGGGWGRKALLGAGGGYASGSTVMAPPGAALSPQAGPANEQQWGEDSQAAGEATPTAGVAVMRASGLAEDGATPTSVAGAAEAPPRPAGWGRKALLAATAPAGAPPSTQPPSTQHQPGWGRSALLSSDGAELSSTAPAQPSEPAPPAPSSGGWGRSALLSGNSSGAPQPAPPGSGGGWGRKAMMNGGGGQAGGKDGEAQVLTVQTPNTAQSDTLDSGAGKKEKKKKNQDDIGSWIYILGKSSSSVRAKKLASLMKADELAALPERS